jgi:hypothetical protein
MDSHLSRPDQPEDRPDQPTNRQPFVLSCFSRSVPASHFTGLCEALAGPWLKSVDTHTFPVALDATPLYRKAEIRFQR